MNILVINLDKAIFSKNSASLERLKEYSQLVDKIFVVVWTKEKVEPIVYKDKLYVYPTNSRWRWRYYFDSMKITKNILTNHKVDLLFTQDPFETGLAGYLISKAHKIKLQLQVHTDFLSPYFRQESIANKLRVILGKILVKKADSLRVVSQRIKRSLVKLKVPAEKIFVLPIFTDINKITATPVKDNLKNKYLRFNFIILMASRLARVKNIDLAIAAMPEVLKKNPQAGLVIVGSGREEKNILAKIKKLKLSDNVILEPWTNNLASYYKSADLFLLTSNYEGWGMSIVEAMAVGCPVIMTDVGCAGELVKDKVTGQVIPVGDVKALSQAIIKDNELRSIMKTKALAAVKQLPAKEEYLKKYKQSWELVLK